MRNEDFPESDQGSNVSPSNADSTDSVGRHAIADKERVSKEEYVGILIDMLKMRKNICVSRHFQNLNKGSLFRPDR